MERQVKLIITIKKEFSIQKIDSSGPLSNLARVPVGLGIDEKSPVVVYGEWRAVACCLLRSLLNANAATGASAITAVTYADSCHSPRMK